FFSLIGAAAPDFCLAIVAIVIFAVKLHVLPTSGTGTFWHWVLPVSVLFILPFGLILQVVRGSMISVMLSAPSAPWRASSPSWLQLGID
ncbi:hypothetical protein AB9F42_34475, partial [Rhizobium leguminosarum]